MVLDVIIYAAAPVQLWHVAWQVEPHTKNT